MVPKVEILEAVGGRHTLDFQFTEFDWGCERFHKTGRFMPDDGLAQLREFDAIFLGAVGFPGVPDHVSLWELLIPIRRAMQQYINLRPVRMMAGMPCPLAGRGPEDIDFWVIRENNEGDTLKSAAVCPGHRERIGHAGNRFTRRGTDGDIHL